MANDLRGALETAQKNLQQLRNEADDEMHDALGDIESDISEALDFLSNFETRTDDAWSLLY